MPGKFVLHNRRRFTPSVNKKIALFCLMLSASAMGLGAYLSAVSAKPTGATLSILCLGDSITAGTHGDGDSGTGSYPDFLARRLKATNIDASIANKGENGWVISQVGDQVDTWKGDQEPDLIFLQIGTNDLEQNATPQVAAQRLMLLIDRIVRAAPDANLYVASVTRVRADNKPNLPPETAVQFNALIPPIVRTYQALGCHVQFADLYRHSGMKNEDLGPDGEHPNDSGYQKMANFWYGIVTRYERSLHVRGFNPAKSARFAKLWRSGFAQPPKP